jgi:hypothetical protein
MSHARFRFAIAIAAIGIAVPAAAQPGQMVPLPEQAGDQELAPGPAPEIAPAPYETAPMPPPGARVDFRSSGAMQFDVYVDQQPACHTPCSLQLDPSRWVTMRSQERRPLRLDVGNVGHGDTVVVAKPMSMGGYATGVTFTTLGGMAVVTGITLTAVGCGGDRDGMCKAGLITGGSGLVVTAGAIWLIQRSMPRLKIAPAYTAGGGGFAARF